MSALRRLEDIACEFPDTLEETLALLADDQTRGRLLAGGTDLMVQWEAGVLPMPERAISVKQLRELKTLDDEGDVLRIGSGVTHMMLRRSELVKHFAPSLAEAAATVGGFQIQTMGTIGGSVANASPAGDLAPSLLVANAVVVAQSVRGTREIPATSFWVGYRKMDLLPDEMIVAFRIPKMKQGEREYWRKLGPRKAQAISKVMGSCRGDIRDNIVQYVNIAFGSVAPTAVRLTEVEQWLAGKTLTSEVLDEAEKRASASVHPIDDIRSTARYRQWVTGRLTRVFLEELASPWSA